MLQDLDATIAKLAPAASGGAANFASRVHDILKTYAGESRRDIGRRDWQSQFEGTRHAGFILLITGDFAKGLEYLEYSTQLHERSRGKYNEAQSEVLRFTVSALKFAGAEERIVSKYEQQAAEQGEREKEKPADLQRKIKYIDADLECATGDLDEACTRARREQGLLCVQSGDYQRAIKYFEQAIAADTRDFRCQTTLPNKLSIVDAHLVAGESAEAVKAFTSLIEILIPELLGLGDKLPEYFVENFSSLHPYYHKLDAKGSLDTILFYANARLAKAMPTKHWGRMEVCNLSRIVAKCLADKGAYQEASDVCDIGREKLEYRHHLSRRDQAEYAIRAGNRAKALDLITEDVSDTHDVGGDDRKTDELINLYLQLGKVGLALDLLNQYCDNYKSGLLSGNYSQVLQARKIQLQILAKAIGPDYLQEIREHLKGKTEVLPPTLLLPMAATADEETE